jgi:ABC-2 type transport system ATP-binding protein
LRSDSSVSVEALAKRHPGGRGVFDVSLRAPAGSITGFIGANGAGKSTTLRCILGLLEADSGEIRLFDAPPTPAARRAIGFIPEERGLPPRERARDIIAFHGRLRGLDRAAADRRAVVLLERLGLGERVNARVETLSKGNAQKVQLLCALAHDPRLLVLDEPFSGLDPHAQAEVEQLLRDFARAGGAVLLSTHGLALAERLCDRVAIIHAGRTCYEGDTAGALKSGRDLTTAYFSLTGRAAA